MLSLSSGITWPTRRFISDKPDRDWNKELFDRLMEQWAAIGSELFETLQWRRKTERRKSCIVLLRRDSIEDDPETLKAIEGVMVDKLLAFKRVSGPRPDDLVISPPIFLWELYT